MFIYKISSERGPHGSQEAQNSAFQSLLGAYRMDGHILGDIFYELPSEVDLQAYVLAYAHDAFEPSSRNEWIRRELEGIEKSGLSAPNYVEIGRDIEGSLPCPCVTRSSLILFTTYLSVESPIRCGDCFLPIPLYRLPKMKSGEFSEVIGWQDDYQSCDSLYMNSGFGERFGGRQISDKTSGLSKDGRAICDHFERETGSPTFYYLMHYNNRSGKYGHSLEEEKGRKCPGCGAEWLLNQRLHKLFDFKCDKCRLLSNISWEFQ